MGVHRMDRGGSGMSCNRPSVALGESIPRSLSG